jgi:hypothetical protein
MPILRLTAKLLAEIDDQPSPDSVADPSPLGDWYGHIFTVERRKCVMFINEPTLFVCPALGVTKSDCRQIVSFFVGVLAQALRTMRFSAKEVDWILVKHKDIAIGRVTNRSTLGSLNNRIADTKAHFAWEGGLDICDIGDVTKWLNETPMKPIGYSNGLEQMRSVVENRMDARTAASPSNKIL